MTGHDEYKVMSNTLNPEADPSQPMVYQIRVQGHLGSQWSDWFGGLAVQRQEDGTTVLVGPVVDQAALYGVIIRIRDLGLSLLSVSRVVESPGSIKRR